jgi:hypothetical protein
MRLLLAFLPLVVFADDRILAFTNMERALDLLETEQVIQSLVPSAEVALHRSERTLSVRGAFDDVELATWLFDRLDKAKTPNTLELVGSDETIAVLRLSVRGDTDGPDGTRELQEQAAVIRSVVEFRTSLTHDRSKSIVIRGSAAQVELAQWLARELWKFPEKDAVPASRQFAQVDTSGVTVGVFHLQNETSATNFLNIVTEIRSATGIRRIFTYLYPRAIVVRGTPEELWRVEHMVAARN